MGGETTKKGRAALITGASSGLGAEFARQLAARGYDVALVARRGERLAALAAELRAQYGTAAEPLAADLSSEAGIAAVEARIAALGAPDVLVNNAGFGTGGPFAGADAARQLAMVELHVVAATRLCRAVLPAMIARGSGGIINVASIAAFMALPGNVAYCATKAYLVSFSRALAAEVRRRGVAVQALCPGFVVTEFHDRLAPGGFDPRALPRIFWLSAPAVVAASLRALDRGQVLCVPGYLYRMVYVLARVGTVDLVAPPFLAHAAGRG